MLSKRARALGAHFFHYPELVLAYVMLHLSIDNYKIEKTTNLSSH